MPVAELDGRVCRVNEAGFDSGLHLHQCLLLVSAIQYNASDSQLRHNSALGDEREQFFLHIGVAKAPVCNLVSKLTRSISFSYFDSDMGFGVPRYPYTLSLDVNDHNR